MKQPSLEVQLPISLKKVGEIHFSYCAFLGIGSKGKTKNEAIKNLKKAIKKSSRFDHPYKAILFDPRD